MSVISRLLSKLSGESDEGIKINLLTTDQVASLSTQELAKTSAVNLVSGIVARLEIKTIYRGRELKDTEYYLLNYEPNINQNKVEFMTELVSKLLTQNEVLVVEASGQLVIADSFQTENYALVENVYSNVTRGDFTFNRMFRENEVLHFKLTAEDVNQILTSVLDDNAELLSAAKSKYIRSDGRTGIAKVHAAAKGDKEREKKIQDLFNEKFKEYLTKENSILVLPDGVDFDDGGKTKSTSRGTTDLSALNDEAFKKTAQAYQIPSSLLLGNVADLGSAIDELLTVCVPRIISVIEAELTRKRIGRDEFLHGSKYIIDRNKIKNLDISNSGASFDKFFAVGAFSVDDIRERIGEVPYGEEWSQAHFVTKNYNEISRYLKESGKEGE